MSRKRRISIIQFSARRDGSAMSALLLADGLRDAGWETTVVFASDDPMQAVFERVGHHTRTVLHKNWLRATTFRGTLRNWLRERTAVRELETVLAQDGPDVVYVNTGASAAGVLAARRRGVPVLWHLRELFSDVGGELVVPDAMRMLARKAFTQWPDLIVANSKAVAQNLLGAHADRAAIVYNAVDDRFFQVERTPTEARSVLGLPPDGLVIGVPGTLRPMKGHGFFFEAIAPLLKAEPSWTVAVTGGGAEGYVALLHAQVEALEIATQVRFLGSIDDMPAFYRACEVACIPSRAEPFGRTVIEAMAVGTPVVATAVGGIPEIIDDSVTGRLTEYGDADRLRRILRTLIADPVQQGRLRNNALREADRRYRSTVYTSQLLRWVETLCAR